VTRPDDDLDDDLNDGDLDLEKASRLDELAEEFRRGMESGSTLSATDFAARHPDVRNELLAVLRGIALLAGQRGPTGPLHKGQTVGPYVIRGELGRGGMGVVYEAVEEELGRVVALKALDASRTDDRFRARFQREARAAARLDHPGIVPVFGSGEDGTTLWYAMRRIEGVSLDAVIGALGAPSDSSSRVDVESTLAGIDSSRSGGSLRSGTQSQRAAALIAMHIAEALAYAHAEGVLHRDVKPGNVMLDRDGAPLLTDFGLCKIEGDASLTADTDIVGTLRYLPPEALHGRADARGDVYGTGLVLYELLSRRPAFAADDRASLLQKILHEDPEPLRKIVPDIPGDLEQIVAKATAKLPEDRYASAGDLAEDLSAFLTGLPVRARAPSALYLARLFVMRNRVLVGGVVAVFLALVAGVTGTSIGFVRAVDAREVAQTNERRAEAELAKAQQVTTFLRTLLEGSSPWIAAGRDTELLRAILSDAAVNIETTLAGQPEAEILIRNTIGRAYREIGDVEAAGLHLERAAELAALHLPPADPAYLETRKNLGWVELDRGDPVAALALFEENLRQRPLDPDNPDVGAIRDLLGVLGVHNYQFEWGEIEEATRDTLPAALDAVGLEEPAVQELQNERAQVLVRLGDFREAIELFTSLLDQQREQFGPDHPATSATLRGLASVHRRQGHLDEAQALYEEDLRSCRANFGDAHTMTATAKSNLALLHLDRGEVELASEYFAEVLEFFRGERGDGHKQTLIAMYNLASGLEQQGRFDDAGALMRQRFEAHIEHFGPAHEQTLLAEVNLAVQRMHSGEVEESLALYEDAIESARDVEGFKPSFLGYFLLLYGQGLMAPKRYDEAEGAVAEAWDLLTEAFPADHDNCKDAALTLMMIYDRSGRPDDAALWRTTALEIGATIE